MTHTQIQNFLHTGQVLPIDIATHLEACSACQEYAAMVGMLESEMPSLWAEQAHPHQMQTTINLVQILTRKRQPFQWFLRWGRELGWVGMAILLGFAVAWLSGRIGPHTIWPMSGPPDQTFPREGLSLPTSSPQPFLGFPEEMTLAETDLNCDGMDEILNGTALSIGNLNTYWKLRDVTLEAYINGEFRPVLELTSENPNRPEYFRPQFIFLSEDNCEQLLALPTSSHSNIFGDLKIYRWNGQTLETVLDAPGLPALDPTPLGQLTTVQRFAGDEQDGKCTWTLTTYTWNGKQFAQTSQRNQAISCDNFLRTQPTGEILQAIGDISDTFTQILGQRDLNCDGRFERLLIERGTQSIYEYVSLKIYRMSLETQGQIVWEATPAEARGYFFGPELFSTGGCEQFVALTQYSAQAAFGTLQVYRWNGQTMSIVLETPGLPPTSLIKDLVQQPDQPFTITTVAIGRTEVEPGWCENTVYTYQWDGNTFVQTKNVPVRVQCGG